MKTPEILVVEDEGIIAADIRNQLKQLGYKVTAIAFTGEEAVQLAEAEKPDLVLMDISLAGEMTGIEAGEAIYHRLHIPIIFLTAHKEESFVSEAKAAEPFGYLLKPFHPRELYATIEVTLVKSNMEAERRRLLEEKEELIKELRRALEQVKTLQGLLPICASCKKVRDDGGYWRQIESYIESHSEATFSHSVCPDCMEKLYPDLPFVKDRKK